MKKTNNKGEHVDQISSSIIWDCGSPLYDSYELVSLLNLIERNTMILPVPEASSLKKSEEIDIVKMRRFYSSKRGENISSNGNKVRKIKRGCFRFFSNIIGDLIRKKMRKCNNYKM